jgi:CAAX protease family protein
LTLPQLGAPPDPPELPEAARPRWPVWHGPVALITGIAALFTLSSPLLPVFLVGTLSETASALALLVAILFQDGIVIGAALLFASFERAPRAWHFGVRATQLWPTVRWAALGGGLALGFEIAWIALLDVDETNIDKLDALGGFLVALAVIVVAPVSEELFFRGFFYRALRSRLRVWSAALIDGLVFASLHFEGVDTAITLPVIAVFGVLQCLIYEHTGSLFAVIAVHAAFNIFATLSISLPGAIVVGVPMLAACLLVPGRFGPAPSPFGRDPRAQPA